MMVMSVKWAWKKWVAVLAAAAAVVAVAVWGISKLTKSDAPADAATREQRASYLQSLGWETSDDEKEREVLIPAEFDEVYENYNALQKKSGFDLEPFKGQKVTQYTYEILNYPTAEKSDIIRLDLLVLDGRVIGGDIYSPRLDGFMTGLQSCKEVQK